MVPATSVMEEIEWSQYRWHHAPDRTLPRVLLVGDSIVVGYAALVQERLEGTANVDYFATSKCVSDRTFLSELDCMLQSRQHALVHFNNGLHGPAIDDHVYAAHLRVVLGELRRRCARVIWRNSTPRWVKGYAEMLCPERNPQVLVRNDLADNIAAELGLPIQDMYGTMTRHPELASADGAHWNAAGRAFQAELVAALIREHLD